MPTRPDEPASGPRAAGNWFAAMPVALPAEVLSELQATAPAGLRWFAPEDLHLTIAFFGRYDTAKMAQVQELLRSLPPIHIRATLSPQLLALPSPQRCSAICLILTEGESEAAALMREWGPRLMSAAGLPPEERPPLPHITVARPGRRASGMQRRALGDWLAAVTIPPLQIEITRVCLYTWAENRPERQFQIIEG